MSGEMILLGLGLVGLIALTLVFACLEARRMARQQNTLNPDLWDDADGDVPHIDKGEKA